MCCCGGILAACACSFCGSCCCTICANECGQSEKFKKGPASRVPYIFLTFLALIFSIIMSLYGNSSFLKTPGIAPNGVTACQTQSCQGNGVVYRVSFSLFVFFAIHAVMVHFVPDFHTLWLMIKFLCFCAFLTATFFFGTGGAQFFDGWSQFARVASTIFLVLQVLVLILWAYGVNDDILERVGEMEKQKENEYNLKDEEEAEQGCCDMLCCYKFTLVMSSFGLILFSFIMCGCFFLWFSSTTADCSGPETFISLTLIWMFIVLVMTISGKFEGASIFVAGIVDLYVTYLLYAGLSSNPNRSCNTVFGKKQGSGSFWLGIIITAAALSYLGFGVSRHHKRFRDNQNNTKQYSIDLKSGLKDDDEDSEGNTRTKPDRDPVTKPADEHHLDLGLDDDDEPKKKKKGAVSRSEATGKDDDEDEEDEERKANVVFHTCMALASIYVCMLYTNWGQNVSGQSFAGESDAALWVNISAQWFTFFLYMFSLIGQTYCICLAPAEE